MKPLRIAVLLLTILSCAGEAPAQWVSPQTAARVNGNAANAFPFCDPTGRARRYQQVHEFVPAMTIRALAFRPNASPQQFNGSNSLVADLRVGPGWPLSQTSQFFDRNYSKPPTLVLARATIAIPPQGIPGWPGPPPFSLVIAFPTPYVHSGGPIVWELVVYSSTYTGTQVMVDYDAERGSMAASEPVRVGLGCWVTGRSKPFLIDYTSSCVDSGGVLQLNLQLSGGPALTPVYASFGTANPNVPLGCSNLYTNLQLVLPIGSTDAYGQLTQHMAGAATIVLPNPVAANTIGPLLYVQAHVLENGSLWNSSGMEYRLPSPLLTKRVDVARILNNLGGATAVEGVWPLDRSLPYSFIGYGLVTEFR